MKKSILTILFCLILFSVKAQQTFTTFMSATSVIGQPDLTTYDAGISNIAFDKPNSIAISSKGVLAIATDYRVLIWNTIPTSINTPADFVLGQTSFTTYTTGVCNQNILNNYIDGICFSPDGNKLIVSDSYNNRVVVWNAPFSTGQNASVVIGQPNFITNSPDVTQSKMHEPKGVFVKADGKLLICDASNHRVLVYNSIPAINGAAADVVIGQNDFNTGISGTSFGKFTIPYGCTVTKEGKVLITDLMNHRVLIFDSSALSTPGAFATLQIGTGIAGTTQNTLSYPSAVTTSIDGKVFIAEGSNRVLIFNTFPTTSSPNADIVIGQSSFVSATNGQGPQGINGPNGITLDAQGILYVADLANNRVLKFGTESASFSDLAVTINNVPNLCIGSDFVTTVTITNNGPTTANNVVVQSALPNQFNYLSSSTTLGTYSNLGYWSIPTIASGSTAILTINGSLTSTLTQGFSFYASIISSDNSDSNLSNNFANIMVNAQPFPKPVITVISSATPACSNTAATLTASGAIAYLWQNGLTSNTRVLIPGDAGIFTVIGTDANGCSSSATINQIVINAPTIANAGMDLGICGSSVTLNANIPSVGAGSWSIVSSNGTFSNSTNPSTTVTGLTTGINTFRWTISGTAPCANSSDNVIITSNIIPVVSITTFSPICFNVGTYTLTGGTPVGGTYSGTGVVGGVLQTTSLSGNQNITYSYTDGNSCTNSSTQTIFVESGSQITGVVNANGTAITNGYVYLLKYSNVTFMDTVQTFSLSGNNSFTFNNVGSGNYLILAKPTITGNNGAYNGNTSFWQNATPLTIDCSSPQTFTIETTTLASLTAGNGGINGTITEGPNFGSGKTTLIGDPIPGVDVSLEQNPGGIILANTQTDNNGKYQFTNVSDGNYTILVDIAGSSLVSSHTLSLAGTQNWINLDYYVDSNHIYINTTNAPLVVGIATFKNSNISVYPNPVHNKLTISNALAIDEVKITTITGVTVYSEKLTNEKNTEIDFSQMPVGIYLIELTNNKINYRTKIIKQ